LIVDPRLFAIGAGALPESVRLADPRKCGSNVIHSQRGCGRRKPTQFWRLHCGSIAGLQSFVCGPMQPDHTESFSVGRCCWATRLALASQPVTTHPR